MLKQFPALSWSTIAGVITAVVAAWESANATGVTNWWLLALTVIPIAAGVLTHSAVVPVETVRNIVAGARTATNAVNLLADKVDVALQDRPREAG